MLAYSATRSALILIVDDDPVLTRMTARMLAPLGEVRFALCGLDALTLMRERVPDLVLLDNEMPDMDGETLCQLIKEHAEFADVPIIFVTNNQDPEFEARCFDLGALDYVKKPILESVLVARARTQIRLKQLSDGLRISANQDSLTQLANRRVLDETLDREWHRALRTSQPLSLLLVDIDYFKLFNDLRGHPAGDECLRQFAVTLSKIAVRSSDLAARYGGEQFAVVLPETGADGAQIVAQRLFELLEDAAIPHPGSPVSDHVTASVGISTLDPTDIPRQRRPEHRSAPWPATELIAKADRALYEAKRDGRGRISFLPFGCPFEVIQH